MIPRLLTPVLGLLLALVPALSAQLVLLTATDGAAAFILVIVTDTTAAILVLTVQPEPPGGS